jgi:hypothetical protein
MTDPRLEDHVVGLEQELVELVERRQRALVQGRVDDVITLEGEISDVQAELVAAAETTVEPGSSATVRAEPARAVA